MEGNRVTFQLDTGQSKITDTITLPEPPMLAVNDRGYLLTRLTEPGQKIKVPSFDPVSLSGRESVITYHGQEKTFVRRRLKVLHHFTEAVAGMRTSFWLDDRGRVVKEESPAGFQFVAEPEFRAKDIVSSGNELLSAVAVPLQGPCPPLTQRPPSIASPCLRTWTLTCRAAARPCRATCSPSPSTPCRTVSPGRRPGVRAG